ncbi:hypothetical protein M2137_002479 [Parabacteroides sp. PFB2-10]|nr:hypothetical protein [Parabacteroides sp. PFB2-10]
MLSQLVDHAQPFGSPCSANWSTMLDQQIFQIKKTTTK